MRIKKEVISVLNKYEAIEVSNVTDRLDTIRIKINDEEILVNGNEMIEACKEALES